MSSPPPAAPSAGRTLTITFSGSPARSRRPPLSPAGASLKVNGLLREPLRLTLGQLQISLVERGAAKIRGTAGRFPVLKRLSATSVVPAQQEWRLALDDHGRLRADHPRRRGRRRRRVLFPPLTASGWRPRWSQGAWRRWPPTRRSASRAILGVLFRVAEPSSASSGFHQYGLSPLADREVPPTLRRSLPPIARGPYSRIRATRTSYSRAAGLRVIANGARFRYLYRLSQAAAG